MFKAGRENLRRRLFLLHWKTRFLELGAWILFFSGTLKLVNGLVNSVQTKRNGTKGWVFPYVQKRRSRNLQILVYHRVNDEYDPFFPATPIKVFTRQMDYVASNCNVLSLEDAVLRLRHRDLPANAIVVTFDDGYRDNFLNAMPVLERFGVPATIFLAAAAVESKGVLWHDRIFSAFRESEVSRLDGFGGDTSAYHLTTLDEKLFALQDALRFLRSIDDTERMYWVKRLENELRVQDRMERPDLMLRWEDIEVMRGKGMSFGSHSVSHPILSRLPEDCARMEICESKRTLEKRLGAPVTAFAYPSGRKSDFDGRTKEMVKEAGYDCAVTMIFGVNETDQDPYELRRGNPWEGDLARFAIKLNWYKWYS
jgi:peptidoglycan/xylan/chitin deacetylase (PgdA/CDA1 family)